MDSQRLESEVDDCNRNSAMTGVSLQPPPSGGNVFIATITGPAGSSYADGIFMIRVVIPDQYSLEEPTFTFITKIWHPNVSKSGIVFLDILTKWSPIRTIKEVLLSLRGLLLKPAQDKAQNKEAADEFRLNVNDFIFTSWLWAEVFAKNLSTGIIDKVNKLIQDGTPKKLVTTLLDSVDGDEKIALQRICAGVTDREVVSWRTLHTLNPTFLTMTRAMDLQGSRGQQELNLTIFQTNSFPDDDLAVVLFQMLDLPGDFSRPIEWCGTGEGQGILIRDRYQLEKVVLKPYFSLTYKIFLERLKQKGFEVKRSGNRTLLCHQNFSKDNPAGVVDISPPTRSDRNASDDLNKDDIRSFKDEIKMEIDSLKEEMKVQIDSAKREIKEEMKNEMKVQIDSAKREIMDFMKDLLKK